MSGAEGKVLLAVRLTGREVQVLRLMAHGCTYDVHSAPAAVMRAVRLGLLEV